MFQCQAERAEHRAFHRILHQPGEDTAPEKANMNLVDWQEKRRLTLESRPLGALNI